MNTTAKVRAYIQENFLYGNDGKLGDRDSLLDRGIIDSTGVMEVVAFIETEFALTIHDTDLVPENLDSIGSIAAFIERKREEENPAGRSQTRAA